MSSEAERKLRVERNLGQIQTLHRTHEFRSRERELRVERNPGTIQAHRTHEFTAERKLRVERTLGQSKTLTEPTMQKQKGS